MNSSAHPPHHRRKLTRPPDHEMSPKDEKDRRGTTVKRPDPPPHSSSFSKRHASFDSPREIPLPSPSLNQTGQAAMRQLKAPDSSQLSSVFTEDSDWELVIPGTTKLHKDKGRDKTADKGKDKAADKSKDKAKPPAKQDAPPVPAPPVPPPSSFLSKAGKLKQAETLAPSGSTILPYSRPYSLPEAHSYQGRSPSKGNELTPAPAVDRTSSASLPLPMQIPFSALPQARPGLPSPVLERSAAETQLRPPLPPHTDSSSSSGSSGSLPSAPGSRSPTPSPPAEKPPQAQRREPSRGPAPMPPPELSTSHSGSVASYRPPRTAYTPVPSPAPTAGATAIRRSPSASSSATYPPPEPPVILHGDGDGDNPGAPAVGGQWPEAPPLGSRTSATSQGSRASGASYEPFLSHAPPPVDSWIEVETTPGEYRLIVRLPGFKRDGITLATKKRRILHVVADSWENGGGHFERRISFGYDADLAQVRAEFDGELLRVIIPRRLPPGMQSHTPAPVGRAV